VFAEATDRRTGVAHGVVRSALDLYMEVYDARVGNVVSDNDSSDDRRANRDRRSMRSASKAAVGRADI
jgi:hypothetical protein